jgi:hypothetical protein
VRRVATSTARSFDSSLQPVLQRYKQLAATGSATNSALQPELQRYKQCAATAL